MVLIHFNCLMQKNSEFLYYEVRRLSTTRSDARALPERSRRQPRATNQSDRKFPHPFVDSSGVGKSAVPVFYTPQDSSGVWLFQSFALCSHSRSVLWPRRGRVLQSFALCSHSHSILWPRWGLMVDRSLSFLTPTLFCGPEGVGSCNRSLSVLTPTLFCGPDGV